jgi:nucleolar complex protein 2
MAAKKVSKRTKNFQKNHLQSSVANRRRHQKISRTDEKKKRNEESRLRREIEEENEEDGESDEDAEKEEEGGFADAKSAKNARKKELEEMDIDEFLDASDDEDEDEDEDDSDEDESSENEKDDSDEEEDEKEDAKTREEMKRHREHLESLKETDPEFYEYLQQEDKELLEFDDDDDEEDDSEEKQKKDESDKSDSDEEGGTNEDEASKRAKTKRKKSENRQSGKTLTSALVKKLCENAKGGKALGAAKHLFTAYRAACHYGDEENENDQTMLKLASSSAFNDLVQFVLAEADDIFRGVLGDKPAKSTQEQYDYEPMKSNRWKKVEPVVKSYIGNTLHLLGQLTDASMTSLVLRRLAASVAFLKPFERLTKRVTRTTLMCFSSGEPRLRVSAIVLLRAIAATCPGPALERAVKGVYRAYASNAKFMNANSAENIAFMSACVVEMFGIDQNQSYGLAFAYIRQLATLLRNALAQKTKDAFKSVYCWQYINCLECFERILTAHASNREYSSKGSGEQTTKDGSTSVLRPLAYPVQQIALGAARVLPSARYAPLRIRLLKILNRLSRSMETFAPVAPLALELLNFSELYKAPMSTKAPSPDFTLALRVSKTELRSPAVQDVVVESAFEELGEHLEQHAYSVAFPEISHAVTRELKRFNKKTTVGRFKKQAKQMLDAIERNADYIERKRDDEADFAPKDIEKAKSFLHGEKMEGKAPLTRYVKQLRDRGKERRAAMQAMDVSIRSNKSHGDESSSSDDDDDDGDDEDDDHRRGDDEEDEDDDFLNGDNDGGDDDDDDEIIDGDEAFEEMKKRKRKSGVDEEDLYLGKEDLVKELELSSDEENDDEDVKPVPTKKARKKGGKK